MDSLDSHKTNSYYVPVNDPDNQPLYYNVDSPFEEGEGGENDGNATSVENIALCSMRLSLRKYIFHPERKCDIFAHYESS